MDEKEVIRVNLGKRSWPAPTFIYDFSSANGRTTFYELLDENEGTYVKVGEDLEDSEDSEDSESEEQDSESEEQETKKIKRNHQNVRQTGKFVDLSPLMLKRAMKVADILEMSPGNFSTMYSRAIVDGVAKPTWPWRSITQIDRWLSALEAETQKEEIVDKLQKRIWLLKGAVVRLPNRKKTNFQQYGLHVSSTYEPPTSLVRQNRDHSESLEQYLLAQFDTAPPLFPCNLDALKTYLL